LNGLLLPREPHKALHCRHGDEDLEQHGGEEHQDDVARSHVCDLQQSKVETRTAGETWVAVGEGSRGKRWNHERVAQVSAATMGEQAGARRRELKDFIAGGNVGERRWPIYGRKKSLEMIRGRKKSLETLLLGAVESLIGVRSTTIQRS
jgi:hypothetical protein